MIGSTIGIYRVVRKIGEGGMGAVYEAVHEAIERRVALKVLHAEYAANKEFARRFFNEARAVNRVEHPGLVEIYDFGQLPDNKAYIVMELLKGETLGARLRQAGQPIPVPSVLWFGCQVADALAAAHAKSVIHRDLKPDNVMIIADPYVQHRERTKLLDFGIAKLDTSDDSVPMKTRPNTLIGTPAYMSPEQCLGADLVDDKSDVYSFGVMLYAMLTGDTPFPADGFAELIGKKLFEEPPSLASRAPWVPERLTALVHRLLKKDKGQRPGMRQVASELAALIELQPTQKAKAFQPIHLLPTASLTDDLPPVRTLSTLVPELEPRQVGVKSRRSILLKVGVLCAMGALGVCGLPAWTDFMTARLPSPNAVSPIPTAPPAKASPPTTSTGRAEAPHAIRKKGTSDKSAPADPVKHSARRAHDRF